MRKIQLTVTATALSIAVLLTSSQVTVAAANKTTTKTTTKGTTTQTKQVVHTLANLNSVKITAKSTARLTDVNIMTLDNESILTYTLTITNGDSKTLNLLDYWSKVKTASGTTYSTSLITKDKDKKKLSAGSSTTLTFISKIGKNIKPSNLVFQVIKWDFNQAGYESLKGQFKIPDTYLTSTPSDQSKTLKVFDTPIKAKINQVASYTSGDYNYVNVGLNIQNIGYKIFEDPKVKFVIKTSNGASYPMSSDPGSVDYKIQPQDTKTLNLIAAIPKSIKLNNLELQLVQDDETAKLTLPVATMQMPNVGNKLLAVQPNVEKLIPVNNGKIAVSVNSTSIFESFNEHDLSLRVVIRNTSGATLTVPKYQYELQTIDGYRIPIETQALENLTLLPLEERVINLNVTVPENVKPEDPQLFMNLPAVADAKDNFSYPVGIFALPEAQPMQNMLGQKQYVKTKNGTVGVTLSSLQRLPWSDGDLVSAKITLNNTGIKTILLPEFAGQLKIDSAKLTNDTKLIASQSVGLLGAYMSTDVYVVSKVPSNLTFSQLQISLLEKIGENTSEWIQFSNAGTTPRLTNVARGAAYTIETTGRREEMKVLRSYLYNEGSSSDLLYTEIEVRNAEKHQIDLSQFAGSYRSEEGQSYKASVSQLDVSSGPDEKSIVAVWAKIPKKASTEKLKLVLGEGITDNKFTPLKGEPTGYVNAVAFELGIESISAKSSLTDLNLFPYTLTVKNVKAVLSGSTSVHLSFDYKQTKNTDYLIGEFGHKYLFEVVDSTGRTFEKEFAPETEFKVTNSGNGGFSFDDTVFLDRRIGNYTLNIYDLFQGQKVKLGTQVLYYTSLDNSNE